MTRNTTDKMTLDQFRDALARAKRGLIVTDQGAGEELRLALLAIALAFPFQPAALIRAARQAWRDEPATRNNSALGDWAKS